MRLVIDMQGAQSASKLRGIGRYTTSLVEKMLEYAKEDDVILAFNGELDDDLAQSLAPYSSLAAEGRVKVWNFPSPTRAIDPTNGQRREFAEQFFETFIASLLPDAVLITSLFEGFVDDAAPSIGSALSNCLTAVILYDLIPYIHPVPYLENESYRDFYLGKLEKLRRADLLLAISESSRREAIQHLGCDPEWVANISTASNGYFQRIQIEDKEAATFLLSKGLCRPYIMYAGATDARKNHARLIAAYAALPMSVRSAHQLAIVGGLPNADRAEFERLGSSAGLSQDEMIIVGHVTDEDLRKLYNLARAFIFPSWHEGFGLPALEAMQCGRAVIASSVSSLPEVIGREDALFDPFDIRSMVNAMERVLTDHAYREELERHASIQALAFSWDRTATLAWDAIRKHRKPTVKAAALRLPARRPRLAYISPLPPEQSGISDYSADLLPALAKYYEIEVVIKQKEVSDSWIVSRLPVRSTEWFRRNARRFDRVLYHVGNSPFHEHMFDLLREFPGVVVLHDFFLSGVLAHLELTGQQQGVWTDAIWYSHGWKALLRKARTDTANAVLEFPCNLEVIQRARGVIAHSNFSRNLVSRWYGGEVPSHWWATIPLARSRPRIESKNAARRALGVPEGSFIVCSFGFLDYTKLNHLLLDAWEHSSLRADANCQLVFVGQNHGGEYGDLISQSVRRVLGPSQVHVTGWVSMDTYSRWLNAADVCVQLRTNSRGETSAAVLDCLNYGVPTVINANGSMDDIDDNIVVKLTDDFSVEDLRRALEGLWSDKEARERLGVRAREHVTRWHSPEHCSRLYAEAIEEMYCNVGLPDAAIRFHKELVTSRSVSESVAATFAPAFQAPRILVDVTELADNDLKTGIQRVVKSLLRELVDAEHPMCRVEPIRAHDGAYVVAKDFMRSFLGILGNAEGFKDEIVIPSIGDVVVCAEWTPHVVAANFALLHKWRRRGVRVYFLIHDLLPVLRPEFFPEGIAAIHHEWLSKVATFDGVICVSKAVMGDYKEWLDVFGPVRQHPLKLAWAHNGADLPQPSDQSQAIEATVPAEVHAALGRSEAVFLMVGTLEPRKGHSQCIGAFTEIWRRGLRDISLIIVGKRGWLAEEVFERMRQHPEYGHRLFWLSGVDDRTLDFLYEEASCLLAASEGEGFGLPLVEAARHRTHVLARDLPVFREVGGAGASYFRDSTREEDLTNAVLAWLDQRSQGLLPDPADIKFMTWTEASKRLADIIVHDQWSEQWAHSGRALFWGGDPRLLTEVGRKQGRVVHTTGKAGHLIFGPYCAWRAGRFELKLWFQGEILTGTEWLDITCNQGTRRLAHQSFDASQMGVLTVCFLLEASVSDLEVRVWVSAESVVGVSGFEIISAEEPAVLTCSETSELLQ